MNNYTLESFINFCDDMMIAEEKFSIKSIGSSIIETIRTLWEKFMTFVKKVKAWIKSKVGKDRVKPKDEIARLERELAEAKRELSEKDKKIDSLYQQRSYVVGQRNSQTLLNHGLAEENGNKQNKINRLQKEISQLKDEERFFTQLDAQILNYMKISSGDLETAEWGVEVMSKDINTLISDPQNAEMLQKYKNDDGQYFVHGRNISFSKEDEDAYNKSLTDIFDQYKPKIRYVGTSPTGRVQNYFIFQNIELITSRINKLDSFRKEFENLAKRIDDISEECPCKTNIKNRIQMYLSIWVRSIKKDQMLINKLVSITNGDINEVH